MDVIDKSATLFLAIGIAGVFIAIIYLLNIGWNLQDTNKTFASDLNVLKSNDLAFAQYITANSQTLEYLNKNCKVTSDTNEVTVLTCLKAKAQ